MSSKVKDKAKRRPPKWKYNMGTYAVVKFYEKDRTKLFDCIPDLWFVNEEKTLCKWPPKSKKSVTLRAMNQDLPEDDWEIFECEVVSEGHATYSLAYKVVKEKLAQNYNTSSADEHIQEARFRREHPGLVHNGEKCFENVFVKSKSAKINENDRSEQNTRKTCDDTSNKDKAFEENYQSLPVLEVQSDSHLGSDLEPRERHSVSQENSESNDSEHRNDRGRSNHTQPLERDSQSHYNDTSNKINDVRNGSHRLSPVYIGSRNGRRSGSRKFRSRSQRYRSRSRNRSRSQRFRSSSRSTRSRPRSTRSRPRSTRSRPRSTRSRPRSTRSRPRSTRSRPRSTRSRSRKPRSRSRRPPPMSRRPTYQSPDGSQQHTDGHQPRRNGSQRRGVRTQPRKSRFLSTSGNESSLQDCADKHPKSGKDDFPVSPRTRNRIRIEEMVRLHKLQRAANSSTQNSQRESSPYLQAPQQCNRQRDSLETANKTPNNDSSILQALLKKVNEIEKIVGKNDRRLVENDRRLTRLEVTVNKTFIVLGDMSNAINTRAILENTRPKDDNPPKGFHAPKLPIRRLRDLIFLNDNLANKEFSRYLVYSEKEFCCSSSATDTATMTAYLRRFIDVDLRASIVLKDLKGQRGMTLYHNFYQVYLFLIETMKSGYLIKNKVLTNKDVHVVMRTVWGRSKQTADEVNKIR